MTDETVVELKPDRERWAGTPNCPHPPDEYLTEEYCAEHDLIWPRLPSLQIKPGVRKKIENETTRLIDELCKKYIPGYEPFVYDRAVGEYATETPSTEPAKVEVDVKIGGKLW